VRECRGEGRRERCRPGRSWPGSGEDGAAGMGNGRRGGAGRGIDGEKFSGNGPHAPSPE
jgi:hypothetical protein